MSEKHLKLEPHRVRGDENAWWYEEAQGISICVQRDGQGRTVVVSIPWRYLKSALKRMEKP